MVAGRHRVPSLGVLTFVAVRGEISSVVTAFTFVLVLLAGTPVSVSLHGTSLGLYASLGRYALTGILALWGTILLLRSRLIMDPDCSAHGRLPDF